MASVALVVLLLLPLSIGAVIVCWRRLMLLVDAGVPQAVLAANWRRVLPPRYRKVAPLANYRLVRSTSSATERGELGKEHWTRVPAPCGHPPHPGQDALRATSSAIAAQAVSWTLSWTTSPSRE